MYGTTFGTSPLVFGAFPSLHSGCATIEMLFVSWLFPRMKLIAGGYVLWMWFSTMYLTHHYMIDLVGGSIYAILAYAVAQKFLPRTNPDTRTRLGYLGITKSNFLSYIYSIEHREYETLPTIATDTPMMKQVEPKEEETTTTVISILRQQHRPERLRISEMNLNMEEEAFSPGLSPSSSGYWSSPSSAPSSPITPYSPTFDFNKTNS